MPCRFDWAYRHTALLIFLAALLVRCIFLYQIQSLPFTTHLTLDAASYDGMAMQIARGDWLGDKVFYQAPLYPYFLAALYKAFGHHLDLVRMIQLVLGALHCVIVFWIAKRLFGKDKAVWSGILVVLYGLFVFYEGAIGKDGISVFLSDLTLLSLLWSLEKPKKVHWFVSGAALGGAILTRGNLILLVPLIMVWMAIAMKTFPFRFTVAAVGSLLAGTVLIISPATIRNYVVGQDFVLTTSQAGQNFYIGNNPRASGFFENPPRIRLNPEYEEEDFRSEALRITGRDFMKPSEISSFWLQEGLRFIRSNPAKALRLIGKKAIMFWNHFEIPDNYNYYFYRSKIFVLSLLPVGFGLVAPLGLLGLFLARKNPGALLLVIFILGYMASIVPFHMASRYRLPVVGPLIVFAAYALARGVDTIRLRRFRPLCVALFVVGLLAALVNWKVVDETTTFKAPYTELGIIAAERGNMAEAEAYFKDALQLDPGYAPAHYNLGNILAKQGAYKKAAEAFKEALKNDPEFLAAYENLGKSYFQSGRIGEALRAFDNALRLRPDFAGAWVGKGLVLHTLSRYAEAIDAYQKAIAQQPMLASAHYNLACAYAKKGDTDRARFALRRAIALHPDYERKALADTDLQILKSDKQ